MNIINRSDTVPNTTELQSSYSDLCSPLVARPQGIWHISTILYSEFNVWSVNFILPVYALHNSSCLWCNVGMFPICRISSCALPGNIVYVGYAYENILGHILDEPVKVVATECWQRRILHLVNTVTKYIITETAILSPSLSSSWKCISSCKRMMKNNINSVLHYYDNIFLLMHCYCFSRV